MLRLLTLRECAELLNVTYQRAAALARHGALPVVHLGRSVRVRADALDDFLQRGGATLDEIRKRER